jgi:hypothetical protein
VEDVGRRGSAATLVRLASYYDYRGGSTQVFSQATLQANVVVKPDTARTHIARVFSTAHGLYEVEINGQNVDDHCLAPGSQSYRHRLQYQVYDVGSLLYLDGRVNLH